MNVLTDYNNTPARQIRKSTSAAKQNLQSVAVEYQNSPNFTGMKDLLLPIRDLLTPQKNNEFKDFVGYASGVLRQDTAEIENLLYGKTRGRISFFADTVEKYNRQNFYRTPEKRESSDIVFKLFNQVKKPTEAHYNMTANTDLSLTQEHTIFEKLQNDTQKINQAYGIYADIRNIHMPKKSIEEANALKNKVFMEMLESPNSEKYLSDYKTYRPYIRQNIQEENIVAKLDAKISSDRYDSVFANKSQALDEMYKEMLNENMVKKECLLPYFSKEGNELLPVLDHKFISKNGFSEPEQTAIINIYKTTTDKNLEVRKKFLDRSYANLTNKEKYNTEELKNIDKLFTMMDENPDTMQFMQKMAKESIPIAGANVYVSLLERIKPSSLNKNSKKTANVLRQKALKNPEEIINTVLDLDKTKPLGLAEKYIIRLKNLFIKNGVKKQSTEPLPVEIVSKNNIQAKTAKEITAPEMLQPSSKAVKRKTGFTPKVEIAPSAKKLVVINDVNEIIKKKLGKNVYDDQQKTYARHATKMRLKLLPEIFDSVKDTRAAARKNGTFNRRTTVKNEDALYLYRRINGKNRRLVNYMLKLRNEDGTRKYNIKDIIETIDNTEKTAKESQSTSPKERKKYFDMALNEKVAEFGKLPITRASKPQNSRK